jgi:hypothetical protein
MREMLDLVKPDQEDPLTLQQAFNPRPDLVGRTMGKV